MDGMNLILLSKVFHADFLFRSESKSENLHRICDITQLICSYTQNKRMLIFQTCFDQAGLILVSSQILNIINLSFVKSFYFASYF